MNKRCLSLILIITMLVVFFTGCGKESKQNNPQSNIEESGMPKCEFVASLHNMYADGSAVKDLYNPISEHIIHGKYYNENNNKLYIKRFLPLERVCYTNGVLYIRKER